jgi:hypothetical protein
MIAANENEIGTGNTSESEIGHMSENDNVISKERWEMLLRKLEESGFPHLKSIGKWSTRLLKKAHLVSSLGCVQEIRVCDTGTDTDV